MNRRTLVTLIAMFVAPLYTLNIRGSGSASHAKTVEQRVADLVWSMIEDPETATLRPIVLRDFEKVLCKEVKLVRAGWGDVPNGHYEVKYHFESSRSDREQFGMEILLKKDSELLENYHVLNVRFIYYSDSGDTYYNSIIPEPWPLEKRVSLVEEKKPPK
jgi:hypothetical protein